MRIAAVIVSATLSIPFMQAGAAAQVKAPDGLHYSQEYSGGKLSMGAFYFKNGQVIRDPGTSLDFKAIRGDRAGRDVGRYTLSRTGMVVQWNGGDRDKSVIEPDPDGVCFNWNTNTICPAPSFKPGDRLTGTFERENNLLKQLPDAVDLHGSTAITFGPGNAYSIVGMWSLRFKSETSDSITDAPDVTGTGQGKADAGTFALAPPWLSFNSSMGHSRPPEVVIPLTVYDGKRGTPDHLYIGGYWYTRRQ